MKDLNEHPELIEAYKNDNLVLFVGSGTSMNLGLPNWYTLTENIVDYVVHKTGDKNLSILKINLNTEIMSPITVLDTLEKKGHRAYCLNKLQEEIKFDNKTADFSLQKKLYDFCPKILTTNYDHAFEYAIGDQGINKILYDCNSKLQQRSFKTNYLIKLHGDIDTPEDCILFQSDYDKHYKNGNTSYLFELQKIISDKSILFIGFSCTDPYIIEIFSEIKKLYSGYMNKHFILTTDKAFSNEYVKKIEVSDYSTDLFNTLDLIKKTKNGTTLSKIKIPNLTTTLSKNIPVGENQEVVINLLFPNPIDKPSSFNLEQLIKYFQSYKVTVKFEHLSLKSIRNIDDGYIFIVSDCVKENLIIEDEYLKSKQININELLSEIPESCDGIFVLTDKLPKIEYSSIKHPLSITLETNRYKLGVTLGKISHSLLKLHKIENTPYLFNLNNFKFLKNSKGEFKRQIISPFISKSLDQKLLNNFIGRKTDTESIIRKMIDLEFKKEILTIKGSGGIGKTTIIIKAAIDLANRNYFKEIHFISCQAISTYENFEFQISKCFHLDSSVDLIEEIQQRFSGKELVIILDNLETLLYISDSDKIIQLITLLADYALIVSTTRQPLKLDFEDVYELRNMTSEEGAQLFKKFYKGVINEKEESLLRNKIVDEILNNNPLAIKLISQGTIQHKSLSILEQELREQIFIKDDIEKIFEKPEDINIEKSKSLYLSIKYSYDKLNEKEQMALEMLSLFPDGIHFENLRLFLRKLPNKVIDEKEIKSLDEKSLLETSQGFLKLQSIINRFSDFHFKKRDISVRKDYYTQCFQFNRFMIEVPELDKPTLLFIHDQNLNNYLKCIEFLDSVNEKKEILVDFIDSMAFKFRLLNQPKHFIDALLSKREFFKDIENGILFIDLICLKMKYWTVEFDEAYNAFKEKLSLSDLKNFSSDPKNRIKKIIATIGRSIYDCEGYSLDLLKDCMEKSHYSYNLESMIFKSGFLKIAAELDKIETNKDFFNQEIKLANGTLNDTIMKRYINGLYKKESLEIIQAHYTKLKLSDFKIKIDTAKFVITNPYTKGLKFLILALQDENSKDKIIHFKKALLHLGHIKYFYLEAKFFYAKYLKSINNKEYKTLLEEGIKQSDDYHYCYLNHLFINEMEEKALPYNEDLIYEKLGINKENFKDYISKYKKSYYGRS